MEDKDQNIDKLFKDKLGKDRHFEIPDNYLDDLNERLKSRKRKKFLGFLIIALLLVGITSSAIWYFNESPSTSNKIVKSTEVEDKDNFESTESTNDISNVISKDEKNDTSVSQNEVNTSALPQSDNTEEVTHSPSDAHKLKKSDNIDGSKVEPNEIAIETAMNADQNSSETKSDKNDKSNNSENQTTLKTEKKSDSSDIKSESKNPLNKDEKSTDNKSENKDTKEHKENNTDNIDYDSKSTSIDETENNEQNPSNKSESSSKENKPESAVNEIATIDSTNQENIQKERDSTEITLNEIDSTDIKQAEKDSSIVEKTEIDSTTDDEIIKDEPTPRKFWIDAYANGGVDFMNSKLIGSTSEETDIFNENKSNQISAHYGVGANFNFKRFFTGVGVSMYNFKDKVDYQNYETSTSTYDSIVPIMVDSIIYDTTGVFPIDTVQVASTDTTTYDVTDSTLVDYSTENKYQIVAIPIRVGYTFIYQKWRFRPSLTAIFEFRRKIYSGSYPVYNGTTTLEQLQALKFGMSLGISFQVQRNIGDWYVYAKPGYRYRLMNVAESGNYYIRHHAIQAHIGVGYTF